MSKRGIMMFIGATGCGKSTSMAALLGYRNENSYGHIITIEDPIEFVHEHKNCIVTQREVGVDTDDWEIALKNTLRQAPDVILIGEVRDRETMDYAIAFAETGHLCLATLHANSTNQALDRIINFFPEERRAQLLMDLSLNIRAFVAQRLIPRRDGKGRVPAVEVMLNSPLISDLIFKGDVSGIKDIMKQLARARHADVRPVAVRPLRGRPHQLRGRAAQRRLAQRPAAADQAARQGSEGPQRLRGHRQPRHRARAPRRGRLSAAPPRRSRAVLRDGASLSRNFGASAMPATDAPTPHPTEIKLHQSSRVLEIAFDDGQVFRLPYEFLRVYSPSAEVRGHGPGQEVLQVGKRDVAITEVEPVGHYAIRPTFSDGHDTGIYSWDYLYDLGVRQDELWQRYLDRLAAAGASREPSDDGPKLSRSDAVPATRGSSTPTTRPISASRRSRPARRRSACAACSTRSPASTT